MYRSGLVPRRVALFGVIGGPMLAASGAAVLFGLFKAGSPMQGIATIPEVIWEGLPGHLAYLQGIQSLLHSEPERPPTPGPRRVHPVDAVYLEASTRHDVPTDTVGGGAARRLSQVCHVARPRTGVSNAPCICSLLVYTQSAAHDPDRTNTS